MTEGRKEKRKRAVDDFSYSKGSGWTSVGALVLSQCESVMVAMMNL